MTEHSHEGRTPRRNPEQRDARPRRPLREVVSDLDHDILRLLLRRHNLLTRMRGDKPRLEPAEEKFLRESWEAAAARVSRDPRLTGHFFSLMQEVVFQPRPVAPDAQENGADQRPEPPRTAFNLAPPARPVKLDCTAPLACRVTRAWLFLAATSGRPLCLAPCLMNDPIVDCVQMLTQAGAALTRTDDGVLAREAAPLGTPDKVLHAGDSAWNFFLLLGHYLGRPSRVKITGGSGLKLADFTTLRHVLPALGARMVHAVPKSTGLPVRLECSGLLPDAFTLPADVPVELAEALLLAAPGYERPLLVDLSAHPDQATALARVLPVLRAAGAAVQADGGRVRVTPGPLNFPESPELPLEPELAVFLLALPLALGGSARLTGLWPRWPAAVAGWDLLQALGLDLRQDTRKAGLAQRHVDAEAAGPLGAALPQDLYRFLKLGQHGVRILPQRTPCLCQIDPAVHPLEQPHVVKHLQLPDGQAHRRLCHIQLLRRPGEALLGADGGKDLQMPQCHGTPPYS